MDALEAIEKARDCLARVCREQRFRLHVEIPARPGVDDDLVIADGLEAAAAEIARLRAELEEARAQRDEIASDLAKTVSMVRKMQDDWAKAGARVEKLARLFGIDDYAARAEGRGDE